VSVTVIVCVLGWVAGWLALGRPRAVRELPAAEGVAGERAGLRGVCVVVPARDEEANIAHLLAGLCDPDDPTPGPDRIVVVDDHSQDRTAELARAHPGVEVIPAPPLPDTWTGKSWACDAGARAAVDAASTDGTSTDGVAPVLAFLDADVRLTRSALARVVAERDRVGGLVSVQPWHETERPYEQLSCLFNVLAVMGTAIGSPGGATGAFGPVLITSRADYDAVGGHASVRADVVEDLALAQRFRDQQRPVTVLSGGKDIRFRMYPGGLRQLAEGWTKNFAVGAGATRPLRLAAIVLWVTCLGSAAFAIDDSLRGQLPLATGVVLYLAFAVQLWAMFRRVGSFGPLTALLYPVTLVWFVGIFVRSLWRTHVRHSVTWRGRAVSTAADRG
jgi:4,4'-diaponeurosporenoate glycosyltransferase